jgi:hypothetical protein
LTVFSGSKVYSEGMKKLIFLAIVGALVAVAAKKVRETLA